MPGPVSPMPYPPLLQAAIEQLRQSVRDLEASRNVEHVEVVYEVQVTRPRVTFANESAALIARCVALNAEVSPP